MEVPFDRLSAEVLRAVIEEFVTREGTDYGAREFTLEEKIAQVQRQLERGEAVLLFDPATESCTVALRR